MFDGVRTFNYWQDFFLYIVLTCVCSLRLDVSHTSIIHVKRLNREYDQRRKAADPDVPVACINKELVEKWRTECGEVTDVSVFAIVMIG